MLTPKAPFTTLYETVRPTTDSPDSINVMICQGRLKYFPSAAHIKKRLETKNHNFIKKRLKTKNRNFKINTAENRRTPTPRDNKKRPFYCIERYQ